MSEKEKHTFLTFKNVSILAPVISIFAAAMIRFGNNEQELINNKENDAKSESRQTEQHHELSDKISVIQKATLKCEADNKFIYIELSKLQAELLNHKHSGNK